MAYLRSKTTGLRIDRTLEQALCTYRIGGITKLPDGTFDIGEYHDFKCGDGEQCRDENGQRLFLDTLGNEYPESDLELVEEDE